jgi:FMN phosphatase YigB (HAD superfamily)
MQRKMGIPFESMVYVGDNLTKDLIAPRQLGMRAIWFDNADRVHKVSCEYRAVEEKISNISSVRELVK